MNDVGKNKTMRTYKEKEKIVKRYLSGESAVKLAKEINTTDKMIREWTQKYEKNGLNGLKSNTGKHKNPNAGLHLKRPKNKIEELELELMKKEIEIARLKKGYIVKGVGAKKEFVTTLDKNIK
ncbi:MAG: helix-turn-helix domain-containing protein [Bacilli bacterium]|nr:helix-turn-helix domain-containing protein [Bacilli bacterium]